MQSSFKLALTIGASISQSFGSAIKGSQGQLTRLGTSLNKLKDQQSAIRKVELAEANVGKARTAYNHASKEVMRLRKEITQSTQPSQKLSQAFESAKQKTINLSNKLATQKERLQRTRRELEQASNAGNKFARDQVKLGASIEAL